MAHIRLLVNFELDNPGAEAVDEDGDVGAAHVCLTVGILVAHDFIDVFTAARPDKNASIKGQEKKDLFIVFIVFQLNLYQTFLVNSISPKKV